MADLASVSDPTDWQPTKLPYISALDAALRCEICKDFYTAPVITNCCHTFCSLCIRRALHAGGICPVCRAPEQEYRLRKNTTVQDLIDAFVGCRAQLFEFATEVPEATPSEQPAAEVEDVQLSSQRSRRPQRRTPAATTPSTVVEVSDDDAVESEDPSPPPPPPPPPPPLADGLVPCPVCQKRMKLAAVNAHLDKCIDEQSKPAAPPPPPPGNRQLRSSNSVQPVPVSEPLPKLTYSMLTDKKLRQKLRDLGIPDTGSRKLLQERHSEWLNIWNANNDSPHRQTKQQLLSALNTWEKAHTRPANNKTKTVEWSDEGWAVKNKDDFSLLIKQAKGNVKRRKIVPEEKTGDDMPENIDSEPWKAGDSAQLLSQLPAHKEETSTALPFSGIIGPSSHPAQNPFVVNTSPSRHERWNPNPQPRQDQSVGNSLSSRHKTGLFSNSRPAQDPFVVNTLSSRHESPSTSSSFEVDTFSSCHKMGRFSSSQPTRDMFEVNTLSGRHERRPSGSLFEGRPPNSQPAWDPTNASRHDTMRVSSSQPPPQRPGARSSAQASPLTRPLQPIHLSSSIPCSSSLPNFSSIFSDHTPEDASRPPANNPPPPQPQPQAQPPHQLSAPSQPTPPLSVRANEKRKYSSIEEPPLTGTV